MDPRKTVKTPRAVSRRRLRTLDAAIARADTAGDNAKVKYLGDVRALRPMSPVPKPPAGKPMTHGVRGML